MPTGDPSSAAISRVLEVLLPKFDDLPPSVRESLRLVTSTEDTLRLLTHNPYIPPKNSCPVNKLPNELLSHIFWLGSMEDKNEDEDDDDDDDERFKLEYEGDSEGGYKLDHEFDTADEDEEDDNDGKEIKRDEAQTPERDSTTPLPFQVLVSHVCKHWREVAVESPLLWTNINFTEAPPFDKSRIWIERSKGLPLTIDIDCTAPDVDESSDPGEDLDSEDRMGEIDGTEEHPAPLPITSVDDLSLIFDIIVPQVFQWRSLVVTVRMADYVRIILKRLSECPSAPLLEVLELYFHEDYERFPPPSPMALTEMLLLFKGDAPNLQHVALWGVPVLWSSPFLSGEKDLELAYHRNDIRPSWSEFAHMLSSSPDLTTLTICLSGPSGEPGDWPSTSEGLIELPSLENLVLGFHPPEYISPLLRLISTPNLLGLALDFDEADYSSFARQLASPVAGRSKSLLAGLENLKISGLPCDHKTADIMYRELSNLRSINLSCAFLEDIFFDKLGVPIPAINPGGISTGMYCPRLETIYTTGISGDAMRKFVEARRAAGHPIKRVFMGEDDDVEPKDENWLKK
jgi:hypothetical protein